MQTRFQTRRHRCCAAGRCRSRQRGAVSLVELMIVMVVTAILSLYATNTLRVEADETTATRTAAYLVAATSALQHYSLNNFAAIQAGTPVPGFANPNSPTMAELKNATITGSAAGYLSANFSATTPTGQTVRFDVVNTNPGCTATNCPKTAMTCITDAFKLRGKAREDLATVTVTKISALNAIASGGRSWVGYGDGNATVRFTGFPSLPNPVKNGIPLQFVDGVVCARLESNSPLDTRYVQMNETRAVTLNNDLYLNSTDSEGNPCRRVAINPANGKIETYLSGCDQKPAVSIEQATNGGLQVGQVVAQGQGANSLWARGDGSMWVQNGTGNTATKVAGFTPEGNVYINQFVTLDNACSPEASLAWAKSDDVWTFARCTNNVWRAVSGPIGATLGRPCATEGAQAQNSTSTGLICTGGKWISLTGRIGQYAAIDKYKAVNGDSVYKPVCASGVPYATAIPSVIDQQSQQSNIIRLFNSGDRWLIQVVNDLNESILDAEVIVETYCYMRP